MGGVTPPIRWPGGKRWLARGLSPLINDICEKAYYEPFVGGGALFFASAPRGGAYLSDINGDLIHAYEMIRSRPAELESAIAAMPIGRESYYAIRATSPQGSLERAARFLYLNRTAFSGLHRTNKKGEFNVPFGGRSPDVLLRQSLIRRSSAALQSAYLEVRDFEKSIARASTGDFVYCDPIYTVPGRSESFDRYNRLGFSWADQVRLAKAAKAARERGAFVLISNAADEAIQKLYHPFRPIQLRRSSCVAASTTRRRPVNEFLLVLAPTTSRGGRALVSRMLEKCGGLDAKVSQAA